MTQHAINPFEGSEAAAEMFWSRGMLQQPVWLRCILVCCSLAENKRCECERATVGWFGTFCSHYGFINTSRHKSLIPRLQAVVISLHVLMFYFFTALFFPSLLSTETKSWHSRRTNGPWDRNGFANKQLKHFLSLSLSEYFREWDCRMLCHCC